MSNVNKVKLLSEHTSGIPPVTFYCQWAGVISALIIYQALLLYLYPVAIILAGSFFSAPWIYIYSHLLGLAWWATQQWLLKREVPGLSPAPSVGQYFILTARNNGENRDQNSQVRIGCSAGERVIGGGCVGGLWQSAAHQGHSKHVWSCLVTNYPTHSYFWCNNIS